MKLSRQHKFSFIWYKAKNFLRHLIDVSSYFEISNLTMSEYFLIFSSQNEVK